MTLMTLLFEYRTCILFNIQMNPVFKCLVFRCFFLYLCSIHIAFQLMHVHITVQWHIAGPSRYHIHAPSGIQSTGTESCLLWSKRSTPSHHGWTKAKFIFIGFKVNTVQIVKNFRADLNYGLMGIFGEGYIGQYKSSPLIICSFHKSKQG